MKKLARIFFVLLFVNSVFAIPNFDPFADSTGTPPGTSYAVGNGLAGQTNSFGDGWGLVGSNNSSGAQPVITSTTLSYSGLPASTGNSVQVVPSVGMTARVPVVNSTPAVVYYSFILKITDVSAVGTTAQNNFIAAFSDTQGGQAGTLSRAGARLVTKKSGTTNFFLGISKSGNTADNVYDSTLRNVNDVLFVVASSEITSPGVTNNNLWINPASSSFGASGAPSFTNVTASASTTATSALNGNGPRAFVISCQNSTAPTAVIDELRIGRSWAFVTGGPEIGTQPATQTRNAGTNATFSVVARGTLPLSYQWQKNGTNLVDGGNISGANTTTLTISNLLAADAGSFVVIVTNSYASITSSVAILTVTDPSILVQPANQTLPPGTNAVFSVVAGGTAPLTYQWQEATKGILSNGGNISGANSATLIISNISTNDVGTYFVTVTNAPGATIQSSNATLNITDPAITSQPQNRTNNFGTTATFQVSVLGTAPIFYQWHKVGVGDLSDGGNISGSQSNLLTITGVSYLDAANYYVTVSNSLSSVDSAFALLTVRDPIITTQPASVTTAAGSTTNLTVVAAGSPPLNYQWQRSSTNISDGGNWSGTTTDTLTIANLAATDAGTYRVIVTGGSASAVTSSNATVTVLNPVAITNQPVSQTIVSGSNVTFSVSATGTAPLSYRWFHDDVLISGANLNSYTIFGAQTNDAGNYTVVVTNSINSVTSAPANLIVQRLPATIYSQPSPRTIAPGTRAVFVVGASGSLPFSYQWRSNGVDIAGANSDSYALTNVQSSYAANYSVVVTNPLGAVTSAPVALTVTTNLLLYENNLIVLRVGDGQQPLTTSGNSVYVDQFTPSGSYINTITIPETGATGIIESGPDLTGTSLTGMALTRSPDKKSLAFGGYRVELSNGTALQSTTSAAVPRAVALMNANGQYTLPISDTTAYNSAHFRGVAYDGTNNFWGAGSSGGTYYFGLDAPAATNQTTYPNLRSVDIFNGNLYCLSSTSGNAALVKFNGLPTAPTAGSNILSGFTASNTTDFSLNPTDDLIYLSVSSTIQKWQYDTNNLTWTNAYALSFGALARYLTVDYSGPNPVIYLDNASGQLLSIVDTGTNSVPTILATAGVNQLFKGIRFAPVGNSLSQPTLSAARSGNNIILTWSGGFILQSASEVSGPYSDVVGATSPYTVSMSAARGFFRLRN